MNSDLIFLPLFFSSQGLPGNLGPPGEPGKPGDQVSPTKSPLADKICKRQPWILLFGLHE